ncbi:MAG: HAD-IA family hydrolase [Planctomycetes bacterium]|nr:HAD-IA family hydrolase [Planctomycetota bacterium]
MLEAIVFDFDGVIVDTEPLHYRAFLRVLEPRGIQFDYDAYLEKYIGFDDRDGLRAMFEDHDQTLDDAASLSLRRDKAHAFDTIVAEGVTPFPGVLELIRAAAAAMPIAICSGALRSDIDAILPALGEGEIPDLFRAMVTADDVARSKPDPESYALAARRLGIDPAKCLAIEDTPAGLESARGAGLRTLAVTHSYPADRLRAADRVVTSLDDVTLEKLRGWFD